MVYKVLSGRVPASLKPMLQGAKSVHEFALACDSWYDQNPDKSPSFRVACGGIVVSMKNQGLTIDQRRS